jgi:hypothetical protein
VAAAWLGVGALIGGPGTLVLGAVTHLLVAAVWGAVFGMLGGARLAGGANPAAGIAYGTVVWVLMSQLVLPVVDPVMEQRVAIFAPWWWFGLHLVFGLVVAQVARCSMPRSPARGPNPSRNPRRRPPVLAGPAAGPDPRPVHRGG